MKGGEVSLEDNTNMKNYVFKSFVSVMYVCITVAYCATICGDSILRIFGM